MVVESNRAVIPISQELVQDHIMNMLHFHFRISNHHAEGYELLKSELETVKRKAWASAKDAEMEDMAEIEDMQDDTRWCWLYDRNTNLGFPERSVAEKLSTAGTLFIPWLSLELHLKVWSEDYSYTNASPDEVKEVKNIHARDQWKK
jgi:hypothetical protein